MHVVHISKREKFHCIISLHSITTTENGFNPTNKRLDDKGVARKHEGEARDRKKKNKSSREQETLQRENLLQCDGKSTTSRGRKR